MNDQNLTGEHKLTAEEASKGGKRSGEIRREKRRLREALENLLDNGDFVDKQGNKVTGSEAIAAALFKEAVHGNVKAFTAIRDTVGEMPVAKVVVQDVDEDTANAVEDLVSQYTIKEQPKTEQ